MSDSKQELLEHLAKGNPANLAQISVLQEQLKKLEEVGVIQPTGYALDRPLGRATVTQRQHTLANVVPSSSS